MDSSKLLSKWQTEFKKGFSKPLILFSLSKEKNHPYRLTKKIKELTDDMISIAGSNIYPMLTNLEKEGLVISHAVEIKTKEGRIMTRNIYEITEVGKAFLNNLKLSIQEFVDVIHKIVQI